MAVFLFSIEKTEIAEKASNFNYFRHALTGLPKAKINPMQCPLFAIYRHISSPCTSFVQPAVCALACARIFIYTYVHGDVSSNIHSRTDNAMAFQSVPNTVKAELTFRINGIPAQNVLYFKRSSAYNQGHLDALAAALNTFCVDNYLTGMGSNTTFTEVLVTGQNVQNDIFAQSAVDAGTAGSAGSPTAANVTKAFTLRSGLTGRSARGRMYFIGMTQAMLSNSQLVAQSWVDDVIDLLDLLKTIVEALGWIWVIVSRFANGVKRTTAETFAVTSYGTSDLTIDNLGRRLD